MVKNDWFFSLLRAVVARLTGNVCFAVEVTEVCVTCQARMVHIVKTIASNKPKAFQLLILAFHAPTTTGGHANFYH
jgi:hypothetical protein